MLIDAPEGLFVEDSTLSVSSEDGKGGTLTLTGEQIAVDGTSKLLADGAQGGGLIQVGGSWQNSDPTVREAQKTLVLNGSHINASAIEKGNGGEVVVWSNINDPESLTFAQGRIEAGGGGGIIRQWWQH